MPNVRRLPPLSEAQLEIMNIVWQEEEVTLGHVWEQLAERRSVARNTVQTLISRMCEKGWLKHRKQGRAFYYRAAVRRDMSLRTIVARFIDSAFSGSAEDLVVAMLEGRQLSDDEVARIRALIDQAKGNQAKENEERPS